MMLLRRFFGSLAGVYCWSRLAAGYAIESSSLSGFQHVFPKSGRVGLDALEFSWGSSQRSAEPIVPPGLEEWILDQRKISLRFLLDNIAPNGTNARDAAAGAVLASPSRESPDYYYQWVRDAAITIGDVVAEYGKTADADLKSIIDHYADLQGVLQHTFNPSGGYTTGGLGEPKFHVDGAPFTEFVSSVERNWGRPQRDGPALRALTLMKFIRTLNATNPSLIEKEWLRRMYDGKIPTQSIIKADLEYISHSWNLTGFDLWEEVNDLHFYTAIVQHKALVEGRNLAVALDDSTGASWYESQQLELKNFLETSFWNQEGGHLMSMLNTPDRGGLDCALLLGALHGGQEDVFPPWSNKILASLEKLVSDMEKRHPINKKSPPYYPEGRLRGVGIGRYPEDIYDGVGTSEANPWFLCTSSVSNILYSTISRFIRHGYFDINDTNVGFFNRLHPLGKAGKGRYFTEMPEFQNYLVDMFKYADSFLNVIRWHASEEGRLSEQFNKYDGFQRGARDLTWSYGSFIAAVEDRIIARDGLLKTVV